MRTLADEIIEGNEVKDLPRNIKPARVGRMMIDARQITKKKERDPLTQEKTARISELTRLSRERALTKEEEEERRLLSQAHIGDFSHRQKLDNTLVQYSDGTCITLEESAKNRDKSPDPNNVV